MIDKYGMLKKERSTKMSKQMIHHVFEVTHEDCIIKGKDVGQAGCPPKFEQPTVV